MSKSIATPNYSQIAQSTAELLLLLNNVETGLIPPYWNYTFGFDFDNFYSAFALLAMQSAVSARGIPSVCPSVHLSFRHVPVLCPQE